MTAEDGASVRVPGWPPVMAGSLLDPATVRWLSISPDGTITTHSADNVAGRVPDFGVLIQWALLRDVSSLICPPGYVGLRELVMVHSASGTVLSPRRRGNDPEVWPVNRLATAMVRSLADVTPSELPLHGTVAWLGELDMRGLHVDVPPDRVQALTDYAAVAARG